jgi:hypothetical protein
MESAAAMSSVRTCGRASLDMFNFIKSSPLLKNFRPTFPSLSLRPALYDKKKAKGKSKKTK